MPTFWPAGRFWSMVAMGVSWKAWRRGKGSAEMADVVVSRFAGGDANLEFGIAGDAEFFTGRRLDPAVAASQLVFAGAGHAFHDLGRAGAESEGGRQDHAHRFFA